MKYIFMFLLLFAINARAEVDVTSNIYIDSESLSIDHIAQKVEYIGEVVLWFDGLVLKTGRLEIIYKMVDNKRQIDKVIIPTKLIAKKEDNKELLIADSALYLIDKAELILIGNVILQREENILKTDKLNYFTSLRSIVRQ